MKKKRRGRETVKPFRASRRRPPRIGPFLTLTVFRPVSRLQGVIPNPGHVNLTPSPKGAAGPSLASAPAPHPAARHITVNRQRGGRQQQRVVKPSPSPVTVQPRSKTSPGAHPSPSGSVNGKQPGAQTVKNLWDIFFRGRRGGGPDAPRLRRLRQSRLDPPTR